MKFMVSWSIDQDKWMAVLQKFSSLTPEQQMDGGEGVTILGRWHEMASRTGVAIVEASDAGAVHRFLGQWNPYMDMDVAPVLDDAECTATAKAILRDHAG